MAKGQVAGAMGGGIHLSVTALSGTYANVLTLYKCSPQVPAPLHCYTCVLYVCLSAGYAGHDGTFMYEKDSWQISWSPYPFLGPALRNDSNTINIINVKNSAKQKFSMDFLLF